MSLAKEYLTAPITEKPFIGRAHPPLFGGYVDNENCGFAFGASPIDGLDIPHYQTAAWEGDANVMLRCANCRDRRQTFGSGFCAAQ